MVRKKHFARLTVGLGSTLAIFCLQADATTSQVSTNPCELRVRASAIVSVATNRLAAQLDKIQKKLELGERVTADVSGIDCEDQAGWFNVTGQVLKQFGYTDTEVEFYREQYHEDSPFVGSRIFIPACKTAQRSHKKIVLTLQPHGVEFLEKFKAFQEQFKEREGYLNAAVQIGPIPKDRAALAQIDEMPVPKYYKKLSSAEMLKYWMNAKFNLNSDDFDYLKSEDKNFKKLADYFASQAPSSWQSHVNVGKGGAGSVLVKFDGSDANWDRWRHMAMEAQVARWEIADAVTSGLDPVSKAFNKGVISSGNDLRYLKAAAERMIGGFYNYRSKPDQAAEWQKKAEQDASALQSFGRYLDATPVDPENPNKNPNTLKDPRSWARMAGASAPLVALTLLTGGSGTAVEVGGEAVAKEATTAAAKKVLMNEAKATLIRNIVPTTVLTGKFAVEGAEQTYETVERVNPDHAFYAALAGGTVAAAANVVSLNRFFGNNFTGPMALRLIKGIGLTSADGVAMNIAQVSSQAAFTHHLDMQSVLEGSIVGAVQMGMFGAMTGPMHMNAHALVEARVKQLERIREGGPEFVKNDPAFTTNTIFLGPMGEDGIAKAEVFDPRSGAAPPKDHPEIASGQALIFQKSLENGNALFTMVGAPKNFKGIELPMDAATAFAKSVSIKAPKAVPVVASATPEGEPVLAQKNNNVITMPARETGPTVTATSENNSGGKVIPFAGSPDEEAAKAGSTPPEDSSENGVPLAAKDLETEKPVTRSPAQVEQMKTVQNRVVSLARDLEAQGLLKNSPEVEQGFRDAVAELSPEEVAALEERLHDPKEAKGLVEDVCKSCHCATKAVANVSPKLIEIGTLVGMNFEPGRCAM